MSVISTDKTELKERKRTDGQHRTTQEVLGYLHITVRPFKSLILMIEQQITICLINGTCSRITEALINNLVRGITAQFGPLVNPEYSLPCYAGGQTDCRLDHTSAAILETHILRTYHGGWKLQHHSFQQATAF